MRSGNQATASLFGLWLFCFAIGNYMIFHSVADSGVFYTGENGFIRFGVVLITVAATAMAIGSVQMGHSVGSDENGLKAIVLGCCSLVSIITLIGAISWAILPKLVLDRSAGYGSSTGDSARYQQFFTEAANIVLIGLVMVLLGVVAIAVLFAEWLKVSINSPPQYIINSVIIVGAIWGIGAGMLMMMGMVNPTWIGTLPAFIAGFAFMLFLGRYSATQSTNVRPSDSPAG